MMLTFFPTPNLKWHCATIKRVNKFNLILHLKAIFIAGDCVDVAIIVNSAVILGFFVNVEVIATAFNELSNGFRSAGVDSGFNFADCILDTIVSFFADGNCVTHNSFGVMENVTSPFDKGKVTIFCPFLQGIYVKRC